MINWPTVYIYSLVSGNRDAQGKGGTQGAATWWRSQNIHSSYFLSSYVGGVHGAPQIIKIIMSNITDHRSP